MLRPIVDVSAAAACKALGGERSHVLVAMGTPDDGAVIRFGLGRDNTPDQVQTVARAVVDAANVLLGTGGACSIPAKGAAPT